MRLAYAYDGQGNEYLFTSYDAAAGGSIVNQVLRFYNGFGQIAGEEQAVDGAVDTVLPTTPEVDYTYSDGSNNQSLLLSYTYPYTGGHDWITAATYNYNSGLDCAIGRVSSISDANGIIESYSYLGLDTVVKRSNPQSGIDLTYIKQGTESNGEAGDEYAGLDRFGRVVDQRWINTSTNATVDRYKYGYDQDGNRVWENNLTSSTADQLFTYDGLNQITHFQQGTLNSTHTALTGTASLDQSWIYDSLGNWLTMTDNAHSMTFNQTFDQQNNLLTFQTYDYGSGDPYEFDPVDGAVSHNANGNTSAISPLPFSDNLTQMAYDAWNRVVEYNVDASEFIYTAQYDALGRRTYEANGNILYYSPAGQVIQERSTDGVIQKDYLWSPAGQNTLVYCSTDGDDDVTDGLEVRTYAIQDANLNVTALLDTGGSVTARYAYSPFGQAYVGSTLVPAWQYGFQGGRYDSNFGFYNFQARDYWPDTGRWLTMDPMGFAAGDTDLYRFEGNGPVDRLDPSGLIVQYVVGAAVVVGGSALIGYVSNGLNNLKNGCDFSDNGWEAAAAGAAAGVTGVGAGALVTAATGNPLAGAAAGGGAGSATYEYVFQKLTCTGPTDWNKVLVAGGLGTVLGLGIGAAAPYLGRALPGLGRIFGVGAESEVGALSSEEAAALGTKFKGEPFAFGTGSRADRVSSIVNEASDASGVNINSLVDEVVYDPAGSYFTVDEVTGQRTLGLGASAFERTGEGQLMEAAHEIVHAQQWQQALDAAGGDFSSAYNAYFYAKPFGSVGYAADEVAAETLARIRISDYLGGLSPQQWGASTRYINDFMIH
jgi:RHS repeat-associated protein